MTIYPRLAYPMMAVRRAGSQLAGQICWTDDKREEILEIFKIANSWRDSHVYPMRSVRQSVISRMGKIGVDGFTASRAKRMTSIRRKLARQPTMTLDQINDLAGCRAVVDDIDGVWRLVRDCEQNIPHEMKKPYDYIMRPKDDGYRSYHLVYAFRAQGSKASFAGRRVELQIRTRLQHSWATAVEAVGLFRGEDFKAGEGDADWLRLFKLMSDEFAVAERCADDSYQVRRQRVGEITDLNQRLSANGILEDIKNATKLVQQITDSDARFFLIVYDQKSRTVVVRPYISVMRGTTSLDYAEQRIESGESDSKVVLVEVDRVEALIEAYPNYFGDVSLFVKNLRNICGGSDPIEYTMAPKQMLSPKGYVKPDASWIRRKRKRWLETPRRTPRGHLAK